MHNNLPTPSRFLKLNTPATPINHHIQLETFTSSPSTLIKTLKPNKSNILTNFSFSPPFLVSPTKTSPTHFKCSRKTSDDDEICGIIIHQLTLALRLNQFINFGLLQTLERFTARKPNHFSRTLYDHTVIQSMESSPYDDNPAENSQ